MSKPGRALLIVEDDPGLQRQLRWCFDGYQVAVAGNREEAVALVHRQRPPVVTLDLGLPPDADGAGEGLKTLEQIVAAAPGTKVIVVTGNEDRDNAVRAIGMGAYDFYQKPIDAAILRMIVDRAYHLYELEQDHLRLLRGAAPSPMQGIVAASAEMQAICRTVEKVAPTDVTTLLLGESGTGKELFARALHALSPRAAAPLVAINCAAIPETLLESELFGYEKGAFTGAARQKRGKIEYADGGTLFLDEIGDLSQPLQAKLLRFLQEREVERLGGHGPVAVDVRVICATHQDLEAKMKTGGFREDLYYRISEITLRIPPLRERPGDAVLLARSFLERYSREYKRRHVNFSPEAVAAIETYAWPGNVRELESRVKRAVIMCEDRLITPAALDLDAPGGADDPLDLRAAREHAERRAVQRALALCGGNLSQAAETLGVSRPTLYALINKHGLK